MENHYTNDKSADFISYPDSAQLSGHFAITGGLVYFRQPRTDPAAQGCGPAGLQGRMCHVPARERESAQGGESKV